MNYYKAAIKRYRIYALINELGHTYIGKTTGKRLSAVYSYHTCGSCVATRTSFGNTPQQKPKMYLLEQIDVCNKVAYKHVVAWVHIFSKAGYAIINRAGVLEHASKMHAETAQLVAEFSKEPLDTILLRANVPKISDVDKPIIQNLAIKDVQEEMRKSSDTQIHIRVSQQEKAQFDTFASYMGMSQRDALYYLLGKHSISAKGSIDWKLDQLSIRAIQTLKHKSQTLQEDKEKLMKKLDECKESKAAVQAPKTTVVLHSVQNGVQDYFNLLADHLPPLEALPRYSYKTFTRSIGKDKQYDYPAEDGFFLFMPEAILYGRAKPPVVFLIGTREDGRRCKLRLYTKWLFVGASPLSEGFAKKGITWYVCSQKAADGASDIVQAYPIIQQFKQSSPAPFKEHGKMTLEMQLRLAEARRRS